MLRFSGLTETESTRAWTVAWESLKKEGMPESFLKSEEGMDVLQEGAQARGRDQGAGPQGNVSRS